MPVTYLITFQVVPDQRERFLGLLNGVLDAMRHEPMFHSASLHIDPDDANRLMLCETWEDHDDVLNVQVNRRVPRALSRGVSRNAGGAPRHLGLAASAQRPPSAGLMRTPVSH